MQKTYTLGKVDYNETGRENCRAVLKWEFKDGKFSMSGEIWNPRETDIYRGGQCVDKIVAYFPDDAQAQSMLKVWERWHLNDMKAGSPSQEKFPKENPVSPHDYDKTCEALAAAGLNPDPGFLYKRVNSASAESEPYKYGSAWLKEKIPADIIAEILSWKDDTKKNHLPTPEEKDAFTVWLETAFKFSIDYIGENEKADEYRVKITRNRTGEYHKYFSFNWKQGFGHRKDIQGRAWDRNKDYRGGISYQFSPKKSAPKIKNVIDSLIQDARAYDDNRDFLDFAEYFGYEDKKQARRIHGACEKTYEDLREIFKADFHKLLQDENYIPAIEA